MTAEGIRRTELPSGLVVLTERMPDVRSVSCGIWVGVGSRDEDPVQAGASHYLEHLLFKGTSRRSAMEIAQTMDAIGAVHNAFTSKEETCYLARTIDHDLPLALDVLGDMVCASRLTQEDLDSERTVILEEIGLHADTPDDVAGEQFDEIMFAGHPLGRPVLGSTESITAMTRDRIADYWRAHYGPGNLVVTAAGNVEHGAVVELAERALSDPGGPTAGRRPPRAAPALHGGVRVHHKDTEQAHVMLGGGGVARSDPRRFALEVFNTAFGGGMSSRLFQEVREKRGLVYSIYSYAGRHEDTGTFGVSAGTAPQRVHDVLDVVRDEHDRARADGLTEEEITRAKGHLKGSLVLGMEDSASRMTRLGRSEISGTELLTTDETVARIDAVTPTDVAAIAKEVLDDGRRVLSVVGPFSGSDDFTKYVG